MTGNEHQDMGHFASSEITSVDVAVLSSLFDHAADVAFFVKDANGRYVVVNESLSKRHGHDDKSLAIGKRPSDICADEYGVLSAQQDAKVISDGVALIEHLEMHWLLPHQPVWCLTTKLPITDSKGDVIGLVGFSQDISVVLPLSDVPADFAVALDEFKRSMSEKVTPGLLAEQSKIKPQQLARLTKRVYGLTPGQLITKIRISAACRFLKDPAMSISQVATDCGYYDHSAFTRAFRSATGVTPTGFRKRIQKPK